MALAKRLLAEGHTVSAVPGFNHSSMLGLVSVPLSSAGNDASPWQQVRRVEDIAKVVRRIKPDLVVCLHVESSDAGLVEELKSEAKGKYLVFGVSQRAALLETSKAFGLWAARECGLRAPATEIVKHGVRCQRAQLQSSLPNRRLVVKADGLAGGRGTLFTSTAAELSSALENLPGGDVLIQDHVSGEEVALSLLCNRGKITVLNVNFEYKRSGTGDVGPNTPGMGTLAHNAVGLQHSVRLLKNLSEALEELDYLGPLDISFIIDEVSKEPFFLEFTARFGDPELSSELLLIDNLTQMLIDTASGKDHKIAFRASPWAGGVVVRGGTHTQTENAESFSHDLMISNGGMESCYSAAGASANEVLDVIYSKIKVSVSPEAGYRTDIGHNLQARWNTFLQGCR